MFRAGGGKGERRGEVLEGEVNVECKVEGGS
jgi:hypothetical protein